MGCWLNTCAVSHLPIFCGEEVVVVYLTKDKHAHNGVKPIPFYFYGTYDDYGGFENTSGIGKTGVVEFLKTSVYKPDDVELTVDYLWDMEKDGQLFMSSGHYNTEKSSLTHIQIKRTVFETVLENMKMTNYKDGKTHYLGIREMFQMVPDVLNEISSSGSHIFGFRNKFMSYLFPSDYEIFGFMNDVCTSGKSQLASDLFKNAIELAMVGMFLYKIGKPWMKPGHLGQESDVEYHELLAHMILDAATEIKYDYDYEDDDEDE